MTKMYNAYRFKDKDPAIDVLRTMVQSEKGSLHKGALSSIEAAGGPTVGAMRGWFFGKTLRPQNATLEAAGRALGYQRVWTELRESKKTRKGKR